MKTLILAGALVAAVGAAAPACDPHNLPTSGDDAGVSRTTGTAPAPGSVIDGEVSSDGSGPTDPAYDGDCAGPMLVDVRPDTPLTRQLAAHACAVSDQDYRVIQSAVNNHH